jgi:hypothetical protein
MTNENGALSIDFLIGFTIFLLAFIWVVSMIPGLLIGLQSYTIDYDAVAYRTSVILVEDPGEPALPMAAHPWEYLTDKRDVVRFGLAMSKDTPNILSEDKVNRFFCATAFAYPVDYQNKTIFGDYPYRFNISLLDVGSNKVLSVGDVMDPNSSYGTIRRLVKIKGSSYATINTTNLTYMNKYHYLNGGNDTTQHNFIFLINQNELLTGPVRDPIYQINPATEDITINITNINSTLSNPEQCFSINLSRITVSSEDQNTNTFYTVGYLDNPIVDGIQYNQSFTPPFGVKNNISMILDPSFIPWSNYKLVYVTLPFNLVKNNTACPSPPYNFTGSRFLNNTFTSPFDYNYDPNNVTQADLRDAVLEVDVGSGYRTATQIIIGQLTAAFKATIQSGFPTFSVKFEDKSTPTSAPVSWDWDYGDGTPHGTSSILTHNYAAAGTYNVTLTVKDTNGVIASTTKTIDLAAPVAGFTLNPSTGDAPLTVTFTDTSTGGTPSNWFMDFGDLSNSSSPSPWSHTYTVVGTYTANLTVSNYFGPSSATNQVTVNPPTVTGISPTSGALAGGTSVAITGTGFTSATAVKFGGTPATSFTVNSATLITAISPAHSAGTVDVTVTIPGGTSAISINDQYTYSAAPTVTGISPTSGPAAGGTSVTITGTGFTGATAVKFGGTSATSFTVNSATSITAISPAKATGGTVDVTVTTPGGTSATSVNDRFTYTGVAPTVTSISPTSGTRLGGTTVTITGTGFTSAATVRFGATAGTGVTFVSDTQITVTSPAKAAGGTVDVTVTTTGGTSATSANDQFTYTGVAPTVTSISPTSGPATGGTSVTITGTGFTSAATVRFGATAGTGVTFVSDTQITVTSPAKAAGGTVDVTVTTTGGTSATSANDRFTYTGVAPTVTSISPTSGTRLGGTSVTITGTGFTSAATVRFGATAGTGVTFVSDTQITVTSPAHATGTVDVTVTTTGGTSATSVNDRFTYT